MSTASLAVAVALPPARRLRIALVTETYPPEVNGVAMTSERLVRGLVARGHQVQLIRPRQDRKKDRVRQEGHLEIRPQPGFRIPFYQEVRLGLPVGWRLYHLWRQQQPDIVHLVTPGPLAAAALGSARWLGITVSSGFHTHFQSYIRCLMLSLVGIRVARSGPLENAQRQSAESLGSLDREAFPPANAVVMASCGKCWFPPRPQMPA